MGEKQGFWELSRKKAWKHRYFGKMDAVKEMAWMLHSNKAYTKIVRKTKGERMMYKAGNIIDAHVHTFSFLFQDDYFHPEKDVKDNACVQSILKLMDKNGIDQAVGLVSQGMSILPLENQAVIKIAKALPERFPYVMVGFSQPKDQPWLFDSQQAADEMETYLQDPIVKGFGEVALEAFGYMAEWPQVWPRLRPVFEVLAAHKAPALFHTGIAPFMQMGSDGARVQSRRSVYFGNPMLIDDIAAEFPEVPIIIGHAGVQSYFYYGSYADMALIVAARHGNVFLETSSVPYEVLQKAVEDPAIGPEKIIFGSDSPAFYGHFQSSKGEYYPTYGKTGPGEFVPDHYKYELDYIQRLPITEAQKQMILGGTLQKILDGKKEV